MESLWNYDIKPLSFPVLNGDAETEVLVVGGGIAGILCAHCLQQAGVEYILAEANSVCGGVTQNTTAKVTAQHGVIYGKLARTYGIDYARGYFEANMRALNRIREMCSDIRCGFTEADNYIYSLDNAGKIKNEYETLKNIGADTFFTTKTDLPFPVAGAVCVKDQGNFHPTAFLYSVAEKLNIFEQTKITELLPGTARTTRGNIKFKKIVCATHFPFINKHGWYFTKLYQHRSYVIALEKAAVLDGMYMDEDDKGFSFRNYGNTLLLGGSGHRTGKKSRGWDELNELALQFYPSARVISRWATQDCISLDNVPYVGLYSKNTPDMYVITGFNKWGMTSSMAAAEIITDMITGKFNPYMQIFSPSRSFFHTQLFKNLFTVALSFVTPTVPRCPHMGCALKYNKQEHSWDCSCHGSRFSETGKLLDTPAQNDMKQL